MYPGPQALVHLPQDEEAQAGQPSPGTSPGQNRPTGKRLWVCPNGNKAAIVRNGGGGFYNLSKGFSFAEYKGDEKGGKTVRVASANS